MTTQIAPRITVDEQIRFGKPVIAGTRVPVELVVGKIAGGMAVAEICTEYALVPEDVFASLTYAARLVADEQVQALPS